MNWRQHGLLFLLRRSLQRSKVAFAAATGLAHPSATAETSINTDASDTAVGAVLQQCLHGVWTPISFFSRKLLPAEKKYSTFDQELLAMYLAVKKFRYFIEGRKFAIFTDHKPLTFVFKYPISGPRVNSDISVLCRNLLPIYATFLELTM